MYGNQELNELLSHYVVSKTDILKANRTSASADIDLTKQNQNGLSSNI